uniref:growth factor receptor-bound protein 14-like isoform X3 n=1 Tax=Vespula vulgaris TaxID=7454 RepID=UPI00223B2C09|nr:growth factor receptor-bound protein 14-like isoform X3 [Vespula vulgaris]
MNEERKIEQFRIAVDMVGSSTKSESTLLTSATREDAGVEVEVGICRSSSYTILPVESCLHRNITDEAVRNSIDRLAGSIIGNHIEELDELDNPRIDRADLLSKRFSKLAGAFRAHLSGKTTGHHGSWLIETRRRCLKMCNWFPKMCSCLDGGSTITGGRSAARAGSYERLGSAPTIFEISSMMQRARRRIGHREEDILDSERQEELRFYNDDQTWTAVVVEKNLRTIDLCELLKVKRNVSGIAWSVVETWPELGFERTLEDHEDILAVHREMEMFAPHHERKFYFRQDFLKYEFFINPKQFFPTDMVAFPHDEDRGTFCEVESALRNYLSREDGECPQVFSSVWMRDELSNTWRKTYMLLRERKLYTTKKISGTFPKRPSENDQLNPLAHLSDYHIYRIPNARRCFNAPFEWGACLRPRSNAEAEDTEGGEHGLKVIAFHSEKARACWLTAMRLAKYGKQLRENYRAFKNKQCEQSSGGSPKEQYSSYNVTNESVRSRVAMDFTGSVGRIVEDPKEAKDIAESEGIIWRRRWRPFSRTPSGCAMVRLHGLDGGIHVLQPWFHGGLKREIAAAIIRDHGSVDGVFLVRESKSNPGAYVLTYKYSDKVFHAQIQPVFDERRNCWLYTLDKGATKFYDLLQLIEFYQLNAGSLPTRLTHYVQNGVPAPIPRPEDGGASPSPPEANQRFSGKPDPSGI